VRPPENAASAHDLCTESTTRVPLQCADKIKASARINLGKEGVRCNQQKLFDGGEAISEVWF
jgi:hypothetical protein